MLPSWGDEAPLRIANPDAASWERRVRPVAAGEAAGLRTITIDRLVERASGGRIGILKLDVQGAEKSLFGPSCHSWLPAVDVLMIEFHDLEISGCAWAAYKQLVRVNFRQFSNAHTLCIDLRYRFERPPSLAQ